MTTEDDLGAEEMESTTIDLTQVLLFAHRGWCHLGMIPLDSGVQLLTSFGLDPTTITDLFDLGLHPSDIVELLDEGRDLKEIHHADFNDDELLQKLFANKTTKPN